MLHPRIAPKIYRQNDTWHVRVYVPKSVVHLVGSSEIHRSTDETNRAAALKVGEKERSALYIWFNELLERNAKLSQRVSDLADAEIADMARKVYHNYREEVVSDMADFFRLPSDQQEAESIPEDDRSSVLHALLSDFDLPDAANVNARLMLKQRGLTLAPDAPAYTRLLRRICYCASRYRLVLVMSPEPRDILPSWHGTMSVIATERCYDPITRQGITYHTLENGAENRLYKNNTSLLGGHLV